jgi:uncharacterized protein YndB with AHSA1/START domain
MSGHALRVERLLDARRDRVFDAWLDPELLSQWFHFNEEWQIVKVESDARVGGAYRVSWKAPDGQLWHEFGEYREIRRPEKLVMTCCFDFPDLDEAETMLTVELLDRGPQTLLVIVHEGYRHASTRDNHEQGWPGFLDQLAKCLG